MLCLASHTWLFLIGVVCPSSGSISSSPVESSAADIPGLCRTFQTFFFQRTLSRNNSTETQTHSLTCLCKRTRKVWKHATLRHMVMQSSPKGLLCLDTQDKKTPKNKILSQAAKFSARSHMWFHYAFTASINTEWRIALGKCWIRFGFCWLSLLFIWRFSHFCLHFSPFYSPPLLFRPGSLFTPPDPPPRLPTLSARLDAPSLPVCQRSAVWTANRHPIRTPATLW